MAKRIESLGELPMVQGRQPKKRPLDVRVVFVLQAALLETARQGEQKPASPITVNAILPCPLGACQSASPNAIAVGWEQTAVSFAIKIDLCSKPLL